MDYPSGARVCSQSLLSLGTWRNPRIALEARPVRCEESCYEGTAALLCTLFLDVIFLDVGLSIIITILSHVNQLVAGSSLSCTSGTAQLPGPETPSPQLYGALCIESHVVQSRTIKAWPPPQRLTDLAALGHGAARHTCTRELTRMIKHPPPPPPPPHQKQALHRAGLSGEIQQVICHELTWRITADSLSRSTTT